MKDLGPDRARVNLKEDRGLLFQWILGGPDRAWENLVDFTEIGFFNTRIPRTWVNLRA